jgi:Flp pilus assembly protein protease CpaA
VRLDEGIPTLRPAEDCVAVAQMTHLAATAPSRAVLHRTDAGRPAGVVRRTTLSLERRLRLWPPGLCLVVAVGEYLACRSLGQVTVALSLIAGLASFAACSDLRTLRIPNRVVLMSLGLVGAGALLRCSADGYPPASVIRSVLLGWLLSGAAFMFMLWMLRPALVGGGDWKLLTALGAALGLVAPLAAACVLLIAAPFGAVQRVFGPAGRAVPMGPGLAVGYCVALVIAARWPDVAGVAK